MKEQMPRPNGSTATSYRQFVSSSVRASKAARGASKKGNTGPELLLRHALWGRGLRYRLHDRVLPGRPDIVFLRSKLAVFCDGDFWHGRNLEFRLKKLAKGHNSAYWVRKIQGNVARDSRQTQTLESLGWMVMRFWETDILRDPEGIALRVERAITSRISCPRSPR